MICKNCGKKIPNGTDSCPECQGDLRPNVPQANARSVLMKEETDHAVIWYLKKKAVYTAVAALVILVVGANLLMAALSFFNRIDFTQYVLVEVTGYDGRGSLSIQIDSDGLSGKLFGKAPGELEGKQRNTLSKVVELLRDGIELEGEAFGFSNGDEIVLRITNLEAISEAAEQKCKNNDKITYTVKDLKEAAVMAFGDLFDVSFVGFNGAGSILVTPKAADAPWSISCGYGQFYIDSCTYNIYSQSGNAGMLSNGDTVTIGIMPEWEDYSEYLLETYGTCISGEEASYTVSGLSDPQSVDVMSMVEVLFSGVDGSAEVGYRWSQEEYQQGNVRITPRDSQSNAFSIVVTGVPSNEGGIIVLPNSGDFSPADQDLGWFYLTADKSGNISAGDTVSITIRADRFDSLADGALAPYGVEFAALEQSVSVDAAMIPRLVTSLDQVNAQNLSALVQRLTDSVKEALENDWSSIVHGNRNYACYDQAITAGPNVLEARLVCTDVNSNSYSIWVVYVTQVTDSELAEAQLIYTAVRLDRPVVFQDAGNTVDYSGNMQMEFGQDLGFVYNSWWFRSENSVIISF